MAPLQRPATKTSAQRGQRAKQATTCTKTALLLLTGSARHANPARFLQRQTNRSARAFCRAFQASTSLSNQRLRQTASAPRAPWACFLPWKTKQSARCTPFAPLGSTSLPNRRRATTGLALIALLALPFPLLKTQLRAHLSQYASPATA